MKAVIIAVAALALPSAAVAQDWYVAARTGSTTGGEYVAAPELTNEATLGAAVGRRFGHFRIELGATQLSGDQESAAGFVSSLEYTDVALTLYGDWPLTDRAALFAGVGGNYITGHYDPFNGFLGLGGDYDLHGDGWHWSAGASYRLTGRFTGEIQYTRLETDIERENRASADLSLEHEWVAVGARFAF